MFIKSSNFLSYVSICFVVEGNALVLHAKDYILTEKQLLKNDFLIPGLSKGTVQMIDPLKPFVLCFSRHLRDKVEVIFLLF